MANEQHETASDMTHKLTQVLSPNFTFTKRQLGIALALLGILAFIGILAIDLVGGGREGGIGPTQRAALGVTAFVAIIGLTLIPLGDDPA